METTRPHEAQRAWKFDSSPGNQHNNPTKGQAMPSPRKDLPTPSHIKRRRTIILYDRNHMANAARCIREVGYEDAIIAPAHILDTAPIGKHTKAEALIQVGEIDLAHVTERGLTRLREAFEGTQPTPAVEVATENIDYLIREKRRLEGVNA